LKNIKRWKKIRKNDSDVISLSHTEDTKAYEDRFQKHVLALLATFRKYGNPFEGEHLVTAVSNIMVGEESEKAVLSAKKTSMMIM